MPETDFEILRVPRGYSIGSRPVTFGEMPSATEIKGLRINAESGGGTLHAQCVLRGFLPGAEEVTMAALDIAKPGEVNLLFAKPLRSKDRLCVVRPSLGWFGVGKRPSSLPKFLRSFRDGAIHRLIFGGKPSPMPA